MSTPLSLSRRMNLALPENGYQSPQMEDEDMFFGKDILRDNNRRRLGKTKENSGTGEDSTPDSDTRLNGSNGIENTRPDDKGGEKRYELRDRVCCFTWTWFTMTMATGGIANVLHAIPYRSDWLRIVGTIFFIFNLFLFVMNCTLITLRFKWKPGSFKASFTSPSESLFPPACVVSTGTILINICQYGLPESGLWLQTAMQVCFWLYLCVAVLASSGIYLILWSTQTFPIHTMTPIWIFPAYPLLLLAPFAANLIDSLPDAAAAKRINSTAIALASICVQGTGFLVSLMIYSAFIYRLMTQKLPQETTRPGMFVSVGPSGFTVAGIVHLGNVVAVKIFPDGYMGNMNASFVLKLLADIMGLWMWGLSLWFFIVSVGAHWTVMRPHDPKHHIQFDMTWYSFVFPNSALITATQSIGKTFDNKPIKIFGTVLSVLLVLLWIFIFGMMIRSIVLKRILWPGQVDTAVISAIKWGADIDTAKGQQNNWNPIYQDKSGIGGDNVHGVNHINGQRDEESGNGMGPSMKE